MEKPAVCFQIAGFSFMMALSHLPYLIFQHTLDLVAHGLSAGLAEMNPHDVGGSAYLFHQCGRVYDADLEDISQRQEQLWDGVQKILAQLSKLS